ncbi:MAG: hypothetical protein JNM17_20910 [Archangium sp.]|nr:hypothetical protein [Archangium sp.]
MVLRRLPSAGVLVASVVLVACVLWASSVAVNASTLRGQVEQRVVWLRALALGTESLERRSAIATEMRQSAQLEPPALSALDVWATATDLNDPAVLGATRTLTAAIRAQTGALSESLGSMWTSFNFMVGLLALLVAAALVLLVRSERTARALRESELETRRLSAVLLEDQHRHFREVLNLLPDGVLVMRGAELVFTNQVAASLVDSAHLRSLAVPRSAAADLPVVVSGARKVLNVSPPHDVVFDGAAATLYVFRDVTQARELELRVRLNDRLVAVGTLAAGVAHEINSPLAAALSSIGSAQDVLSAGTALSADDRRELDECLVDAKEGAARVATITRDLSGFMRSSEDVVEVVDLENVLTSTLNLLRGQLNRIEVVRRFHRAGFVRGNQARLAQVIVNLAVNAAQACQDRVGARLEVSARRVGERTLISFSDNGPGIPPEIQERIFDPFFTTKAPGQGTGLGLYISHNLVKGMGGELSVESAVGATTFVVSLEADASAAPQVA